MSTIPKSVFESALNLDARSQLDQHGIILGNVGSTGEVLNIAGELGVPLRMRRSEPIVHELLAREPNSGHQNSLSSRYGKGAFPFHTDCAHWPEPARYLILMSPHENTSVPTEVADFSWTRDDAGLRARMARSIFKVVNGRSSFLASILDEVQGFFRFDRHCMVPANSEAEDLMEFVQQRCPAESKLRINWTAGSCVVVDNWRMVHGRSACTQIGAETRVLMRALVGRVK